MTFDVISDAQLYLGIQFGSDGDISLLDEETELDTTAPYDWATEQIDAEP